MENHFTRQRIFKPRRIGELIVKATSNTVVFFTKPGKKAKKDPLFKSNNLAA